MTEFVTLLGAEDVQHAGRQMRDAAESMSRAAGYFDEVTTRLIRDLNTTIDRLQFDVDGHLKVAVMSDRNAMTGKES